LRHVGGETSGDPTAGASTCLGNSLDGPELVDEALEDYWSSQIRQIGDVTGSGLSPKYSQRPLIPGAMKGVILGSGRSPITRASDTRRIVLGRFSRNQRWPRHLAPGARRAQRLTGRPPSRGRHSARRPTGMVNRLVRILHGCLEQQCLYNEGIAWSHRDDRGELVAA
jgi:hypothetical protein